MSPTVTLRALRFVCVVSFGSLGCDSQGSASNETGQLRALATELETARSESAALRAEIEELQSELEALRRTPSAQVDALIVQLSLHLEDRPFDNSQETVALLHRLRELLRGHPDVEHAFDAERMLGIGQLNVEVGSAIEEGSFDVARRAITRSQHLTDEIRAHYLRTLENVERAPLEITPRELWNSGTRLVGRRVRLVGEFRDLSDTWVTSLPGVRGTWTSPEGLRSSFSRTAANDCLGFSIADDGGVFYQRLFARRDRAESFLLSLRRGTTITITGEVIDFGTNNWIGIVATELALLD